MHTCIKDETTPHLHARWPDVSTIRRKKFNALSKSSSQKQDYQTFTNAFERPHMEQVFGGMMWVSMIRRKVNWVTSLSRIEAGSSHRKETGNRRIEESKSSSQRKPLSAHKKDAEMWKEICRQGGQQALYSNGSRQTELTNREKQEVAGYVSLPRAVLKAIRKRHVRWWNSSWESNVG